MSTHTPGPWSVGRSCDGFVTVTDGTKTICSVGVADMFDQVEIDAAYIVLACNAHEEMLEALRTTEANFARLFDGQPEIEMSLANKLTREKVQAAIAKAEGSR